VVAPARRVRVGDPLLDVVDEAREQLAAHEVDLLERGRRAVEVAVDAPQQRLVAAEQPVERPRHLAGAQRLAVDPLGELRFRVAVRIAPLPRHISRIVCRHRSRSLSTPSSSPSGTHPARYQSSRSWIA